MTLGGATHILKACDSDERAAKRIRRTNPCLGDGYVMVPPSAGCVSSTWRWSRTTMRPTCRWVSFFWPVARWRTRKAALRSELQQIPLSPFRGSENSPERADPSKRLRMCLEAIGADRLRRHGRLRSRVFAGATMAKAALREGSRACSRDTQLGCCPNVIPSWSWWTDPSVFVRFGNKSMEKYRNLDNLLGNRTAWRNCSDGG